VSNAGNADPSVRKGDGFASVTLYVFNGQQNVFTQTVALGGGSGPPVTISVGTTGDAMLLVFGGSEASDCGGIGELRITALR